MKKSFRKLLSMMLCLTIFIGIAMPVFASNESNEKNVTFDAVLSNETLTVSQEDQTVTMTIQASTPVTLDGIGMQITFDDALTLTSVAGGESSIAMTPSNYNTSNGMVAWNADNDITNVTNLVVATFTIPANTPAGEYVLGANSIELTENGGDVWEEAASVSATITIEEPSAPEEPAPTVDGYTAKLNTLNGNTTKGETITVNVDVSHSEDETFNAAELIINYDNNKLSLVESSLGELNYSNANGVLKIEDFGEAKNFATDAYSIQFETIALGEATITLTEASFIDKEGATSDDLIDATLQNNELKINIAQLQYDVSFPADGPITGNSKANDGEDYTFTVSDYHKYTYEITVTIGESEYTVEDIEVAADGQTATYTIPAEDVTDNVTITYTRQERTYSVSFEGNGGADVTDKPDTAPVYGTNYVFTLPDDSEATIEENGVTYTLTSITIGGINYTGYSVNDRTYTIPGDVIVGDIVITVDKEETSLTTYTVTVEGSGAGDASVTPSVNANGKAVLTLVPKAGFEYEVTAVMGESTANVVKSENTYTVSNVTGNVIFTVIKTLKTDDVTVSEYAGTFVLVTYKNTFDTNVVPTYDGHNMFYSSKYEAYCYLVNNENLNADTAKTKLSTSTGTAVNVDYTNKDLNGTTIVDAADAQLVWNMYNGEYSDFSVVSMAKFLNADLDNKVGLDVGDALVIINWILENN